MAEWFQENRFFQEITQSGRFVKNKFLEVAPMCEAVAIHQSTGNKGPCHFGQWALLLLVGGVVTDGTLNCTQWRSKNEPFLRMAVEKRCHDDSRTGSRITFILRFNRGCPSNVNKIRDVSLAIPGYTPSLPSMSQFTKNRNVQKNKTEMCACLCVCLSNVSFEVDAPF